MGLTQTLPCRVLNFLPVWSHLGHKTIGKAPPATAHRENPAWGGEINLATNAYKEGQNRRSKTRLFPCYWGIKTLVSKQIQNIVMIFTVCVKSDLDGKKLYTP
jgi:hypothetical protein